MPFLRRWDPATQTRIADRTLTGPAKPSAETGTIAKTDGTVIVANQNVQPSVPPSTPVNVILPSPNEPIIGKDGKINHNWWRFFNQLYLRTGGVLDNVNQVHTTYAISGGVDALAFTGETSVLDLTIFVYKYPAAGSATITGETPESLLASPTELPPAGSVTITGLEPTTDP